MDVKMIDVRRQGSPPAGNKHVGAGKGGVITAGSVPEAEQPVQRIVGDTRANASNGGLAD
jgi:hypothetical protein